jgi:hypothetical protein
MATDKPIAEGGILPSQLNFSELKKAARKVFDTIAEDGLSAEDYERVLDHAEAKAIASYKTHEPKSSDGLSRLNFEKNLELLCGRFPDRRDYWWNQRESPAGRRLRHHAELVLAGALVPKPQVQKARGAPKKKEAEKTRAKWLQMGRPQLTATVLDELSKHSYPDEFAKASLHSKPRRRLRDRIRRQVRMPIKKTIAVPAT